MESVPQQGRPAWLPAELYPFESRYLHVEDAWVHYVDEGRGPNAAVAARQPDLVLPLPRDHQGASK